MHADYLLVVAVAVLLSASNVLGFTKCSKQASGQVKSVFSAAVTKGLNVRCLPTHSFPPRLRVPVPSHVAPEPPT